MTEKEYKQRARYHEKWELIIHQPTVLEMPENTRQMIDEVAQIGYEHALLKLDYQDDLMGCLTKWAMHTLPESTVFTPEFVYDDDVGTLDFIGWDGVDAKLSMRDAALQVRVIPQLDVPVKALEKSEHEYMKRMIPLSYAVMGVLFLSLSLLFAFTFYLGRHGGMFLIGPWVNLMLLIGALGLTVTVVVASVEWRKLAGGKKGQARDSD